MSSKFKDFFVSFDEYGAPISVNRAGETHYKTGVGALCTVIVNTFMTFYFIEQIVGLFNYSNPEISQVSRAGFF